MRFTTSVLLILLLLVLSPPTPCFFSTATAATVTGGGIAGSTLNNAGSDVTKGAGDLAGDAMVGAAKAIGIDGSKALIMGKTALMKKCGKYLCTQQVAIVGCLITVTQQYTDAGFKTKTVPIQNLKSGLMASVGSLKSSMSKMKSGFSNMKNNFKDSMTKTLSMPVENPLIFIGVTSLSNIDPGGISVSGNEVQLRTKDGKNKVVQTKNINSAFTSALYVFTDEDKDAEKVGEAFVNVVKKCLE